MALKFPTQAEEALSDFRSGKAKSIGRACRGAEVRREESVTIYTFDDDSYLEVMGRGSNHYVRVFLP